MGTTQIIGLSIFGIIVLIFIIIHISMLRAWENIEIGDTEIVYKHEYIHQDKNFKWDKYGETD